MRKFLFLFAVLFLSPSVQATPITVGALSSDDDGSTELIYDSLNGYEWLRWDVLADLNYAETVAAISSGAYSGQGWMLAHNTQAQAFIEAIYSPAMTPCTSTDTVVVTCGSGGSSSLFGDNWRASDDYSWFLSDNGVGSEVGWIRHQASNGAVSKLNEWGSIAGSDAWSSSGSNYPETISWLLYRESTNGVPAPATLALFGLGLAGLGWSRRKKA